jgi:nicotinamidase/pyrazinamidase
MKEIIFVDVDTQYDFMKRKGRLYVPDAESIIPNLKKITSFAKRKKISILATCDKHKITDDEISSGAFPAHCLSGTKGQKKIKETEIKSARTVSTKKLHKKEIDKLRKENYLIVEKQKYSAFSNPNLKPLLNDVKKAYVYGVATDYCVKEVVLGLRKMGIETYVIKDAIKSVFKENEKKCLELFRKKGVRFLTTRQLLKKKSIKS